MFITTMDMGRMPRILSRHINQKSNIQIRTFTQLVLVDVWPTLNTSMDLLVGHAVNQLGNVFLTFGYKYFTQSKMSKSLWDQNGLNL